MLGPQTSDTMQLTAFALMQDWITITETEEATAEETHTDVSTKTIWETVTHGVWTPHRNPRRAVGEVNVYPRADASVPPSDETLVPKSVICARNLLL